jgi:ParB family chromosome partitioning protein
MGENTVILEEPTQEELEKAHRQFTKLMIWAQGLNAEQINFLLDGGWYNNAMKGYIISAAKEADFSDEQIRKLLDGFRWAIECYDKEQAEQIYLDF